MDKTPGLFSALAHPLRRDILRSMFKSGKSLSAVECASELTVPLSNVSYHFRVLNENGVTEETANRAVRGSIQHFYRPRSAVMNLSWVRESLGLREIDS